MATMQQFILWLKREKSKQSCNKMATSEKPKSQSDDSSDDQYGMKSLIMKQEVPSDTMESCTDLSAAADQIMEQFLMDPSRTRASMKLPPVPREEGRKQWIPTPCRVNADSPAHIYEEIPWSAVETDYEDMGEESAKLSHDKNANTKTLTDLNDAAKLRTRDCQPYMVVDLKSQPQPPSAKSQSPLQESESLSKSSDHTSGRSQSSATQHLQMPPCSQSSSNTHTTTTHTLPGVSRKVLKNKPGLPSTSALPIVEDGLEKYAANFVQCDKCKRPHGLFDGTQIKHFDCHQEIEGGGGFNRLSVRSRSLGPAGSVPAHMVSNGFCSKQPSSKRHAPMVRTNPRFSQRNFRFSQGSHVTKSPESDSGDTFNEYDIQTASDTSPSKESISDKLSPRSSVASDSATSNLYGSQSSRESIESYSAENPRKVSRSLIKSHESDSSNDTFSEYDIRSSDSYTSNRGMSDDLNSSKEGEYGYYLSKVEQNLWLKQDTLRVIRESDCSEYETSEYQSSSAYGDGSLTHVSSISDMSDVSNCSAFHISKRSQKLKGILKQPPVQGHEQNHKQPKRNIVIKEGHTSMGDTSRSSNGTHKRKSNRRRSMHSHVSVSTEDSMECYTLPDFSALSSVTDTHSVSSGSSGDRNSPVTSSTPDHFLGSNRNSPITSTPLDTSSVSNDLDVENRLSVRATSYKPAVAPSASNPPVGGSTSKSAFTVVGNATVNIPKVSASVVAVKAPIQNQTRSHQHNRLLTDIMKINHDRQLLFL